MMQRDIFKQKDALLHMVTLGRNYYSSKITSLPTVVPADIEFTAIQAYTNLFLAEKLKIINNKLFLRLLQAGMLATALLEQQGCTRDPELFSVKFTNQLYQSMQHNPLERIKTIKRIQHLERLISSQ